MNWYECKVKYEKQTPTDAKTVTECYMVEALGCTEAEARITKLMEPYITGEFEVLSVIQKKYNDVFFSSSDADDKWYEVKAAFITIDDKGREKRSAITFLQCSSSVLSALNSFNGNMKGTMMDYAVSGVNETKLLEVYKA